MDRKHAKPRLSETLSGLADEFVARLDRLHKAGDVNDNAAECLGGLSEGMASLLREMRRREKGNLSENQSGCIWTERTEASSSTTEPTMAKRKPTNDRYSNFKEVALDAIVGKTIQGIAWTTVEGENGSEPCVTLFFSDSTRHGFVLPRENTDKQE